jgi:UDP-GlcNAc:undecaprenyl-phosphate GlcNAc-1-phosphate transferase
MKYIANRAGILDMPIGSKFHSRPTPLLGGLSVYIGFIIPLFIINDIDKGIILGGTLIMIIGLLDDIKEISSIYKLIFQIIATLIILNSGISLILFKGFVGRILNITLTFLWVIGITNAMNFFDGMDGLAAGLGIITSLFLLIISIQSNQIDIGSISLAMIGALLGFLPYNFKIKSPAEIFLGDAGSTFVGFILASLAIKGEWSDNDPIISISAPVLIFSIYIYDMIHITISRIFTNRVKSFKEWLDYRGRDHLHHRFEALFRGKKKSVLFIYLLSFSMGISAIVLKNASRIDSFLLIFQAIIIFIGVTILEREGNKVDKRRG